MDNMFKVGIVELNIRYGSQIGIKKKYPVDHINRFIIEWTLGCILCGLILEIGKYETR